MLKTATIEDYLEKKTYLKTLVEDGAVSECPPDGDPASTLATTEVKIEVVVEGVLVAVNQIDIILILVIRLNWY